MVNIEDVGEGPSLQTEPVGKEGSLEVAHAALVAPDAGTKSEKGVRAKTVDAGRDKAPGGLPRRDIVKGCDVHVCRGLHVEGLFVIDVGGDTHQTVTCRMKGSSSR